MTEFEVRESSEDSVSWRNGNHDEIFTYRRGANFISFRNTSDLLVAKSCEILKRGVELAIQNLEKHKEVSRDLLEEMRSRISEIAGECPEEY